jgi:hypothetical protein
MKVSYVIHGNEKLRIIHANVAGFECRNGGGLCVSFVILILCTFHDTIVINYINEFTECAVC